VAGERACCGLCSNDCVCGNGCQCDDLAPCAHCGRVFHDDEELATCYETRAPGPADPRERAGPESERRRRARRLLK
jgi:hypothetical protein